eukprot:GEMP01093377.1.p1 GENE.GEMP01093377.1~~GEMP01093377.1.p1  ORF type:complete len:119 (+),score=0.16 GEMP01093377.1:11-367(+)
MVSALPGFAARNNVTHQPCTIRLDAQYASIYAPLRRSFVCRKGSRGDHFLCCLPCNAISGVKSFFFVCVFSRRVNYVYLLDAPSCASPKKGQILFCPLLSVFSVDFFRCVQCGYVFAY